VLKEAAGSMKKYIDWAWAWAREASAPAGLRGVAAAVVLVVLTDSILLGMGYIQELPPVSLTFMLRSLWRRSAGALADSDRNAVVSFTYFNTAPLHIRRTGSVALSHPVLPHRRVVMAICRGRASMPPRRSNAKPNATLRVLTAADDRGLTAGIWMHAAPSETLVGRKVLLFDLVGTLRLNRAPRRNHSRGNRVGGADPGTGRRGPKGIVRRGRVGSTDSVNTAISASFGSTGRKTDNLEICEPAVG
jgi:hypothetical protein